jgi:hypothetical protein
MVLTDMLSGDECIGGGLIVFAPAELLITGN